jgi:ribosomal protein S18 acetylase RimI-like enzyme
VAPFVVRDAVTGDLEPCIALGQRAAPERGAEDWRRELETDLATSDHHLVVAEADGAIVGYGRARLVVPAADAPADGVPRGYYLMGMYVRSDHRRQGAGTALIRSRLVWISERDADAWYFANARNVGSIELHRRFGFQEVTRSFSFPGLTFDGGEGILFRARLRD